MLEYILQNDDRSRFSTADALIWLLKLIYHFTFCESRVTKNFTKSVPSGQLFRNFVWPRFVHLRANCTWQSMRVCFSRFALPKHSFTSIRTVNFRSAPVYTACTLQFRRFLASDSSSSAALDKMGDSTAKEGANLHLDSYWPSHAFVNDNLLA